MIDHGTDEVVKAVVVLGFAGFVERGLRVGFAFELGLVTSEVLLKEGALFVGSFIGIPIGIHESCGTLSSFTKMLQMGKFRAFRRIVLTKSISSNLVIQI